ncbi:MAG: tRNA uridine-5-carboxymethylaminomethyl(34) synthesis GTPase MnmE [Lachnospiraceae bacterium]|nr:tRNA uridine-5-carboxymethylaminomethyl(34) synthesis GTPase MnmE [Lachnospiraceae bacterium]
MYHDTIAAIGTAMSHSGIGIVRISGEEAIAVADRIFRFKKKETSLFQAATHTIHYGYIVEEGQIIDEVLVSVMKGPHSYTAEDVVEINCHGGVLVMKRILETVLKHGARPAEAGEFTKRAFLNGRIDLSQAEAVIDLINSKNDFAMKSAVGQLSGRLSEKIRQLREQILFEIATIESALDDPEHITLDGYGEMLSRKLDSMLLDMNLLISNAENSRMLSEGIKTVILGKPNAGKSSLLNLLLGEDRAIVTEIAGTTRDTLEEQILLDGIGLKLIDTAGIRETEDVVEKIGVSKAVGQAENADLILYVVDSSVNLDESDRQIIEMIKDRRGIVLMNKSDLEGVLDSRLLCKLTDKRVITFSAKEGIGLSELKDAIKDMFINSELTFNDEWCLTNLRHKQAMGEAYESLKLVKQSIEDGMPEDFFSIDLMNAYEKLGLILGEAVEDDLVDEIFSHFCMGK